VAGALVGALCVRPAMSYVLITSQLYEPDDKSVVLALLDSAIILLPYPMLLVALALAGALIGVLAATIVRPIAYR
jgi:hypothetical protein